MNGRTREKMKHLWCLSLSPILPNGLVFLTFKLISTFSFVISIALHIFLSAKYWKNQVILCNEVYIYTFIRRKTEIVKMVREE